MDECLDCTYRKFTYNMNECLDYTWRKYTYNMDECLDHDKVIVRLQNYRCTFMKYMFVLMSKSVFFLLHDQTFTHYHNAFYPVISNRQNIRNV